jgi:hypothetical protein
VSGLSFAVADMQQQHVAGATLQAKHTDSIASATQPSQRFPYQASGLAAALPTALLQCNVRLQQFQIINSF